VHHSTAGNGVYKIKIKIFCNSLYRITVTVHYVLGLRFWCLMPLISVISWRSALLMRETGENHRPAACHYQALSHNFFISSIHLCAIVYPFVLFLLFTSLSFDLRLLIVPCVSSTYKCLINISRPV
jgi:hypothetical protein